MRSEAGTLRFEDRIVAVDGVPVTAAAVVREVIERAGPGVPLQAKLLRQSPTRMIKELGLQEGRGRGGA